MKCHIMRQFIRIFTICKSTHLEATSIQRTKVCVTHARLIRVQPGRISPQKNGFLVTEPFDTELVLCIAPVNTISVMSWHSLG